MTTKRQSVEQPEGDLTKCPAQCQRCIEFREGKCVPKPLNKGRMVRCKRDPERTVFLVEVDHG